MQQRLQEETSLMTSELNSLKSDAIIQTRKRPKTPAGEVDKTLLLSMAKVNRHSTFIEDFKLMVKLTKDIDAIIIGTT